MVARLAAAALGTLAVWLTFLAGARFYGRTVGLVAAAIFGLAFLPIFYSHLALNDVPTRPGSGQARHDKRDHVLLWTFTWGLG